MTLSARGASRPLRMAFCHRHESHLMRKISATLAAALMLAVSSMPAQAATAYLVGGCQSGLSVTGRLVYTGVYQYGGQTFERSFPQLCPLSIEIY